VVEVVAVRKEDAGVEAEEDEAGEEEDEAVEEEEEEEQQQEEVEGEGEMEGSSNWQTRFLTRCEKVNSSQKSMPYHEIFLGCSICGVLSSDQDFPF